MKFFITTGNRYGDGTFITEIAIEAERLGFYGVLMSDHYMWGSRSVRDVTTLESWITLTYLAAKTEHIRLGTQFTPIPRPPPAMLAKMLSTLDVLSNGRVQLGVGAGWSQAEFEGYSEWNEPKIRVDKTKEGLELILKLWTEDEVTFNGKYYQAKRAVLEPKPVQKPYPTLYVSGRPRSYRMLRLAGRYADIYNMMPTGAQREEFSEEEIGKEIKKGRDIVMEAAKKADRADKIAFAMGSRRTSQYEPKQYLRDVESAVELGAAYYITSLPRNKDFIKSMKSFAKDILPSFK